MHAMNMDAIDNSGGVTQKLKLTAELLTVLAIGSYTIGFIVVNSYLLTFGYSGRSLFDTTYISAGILFFLLVTPIALLVYSFFVSSQLAKDANPDSSYKGKRLNLVAMGTLAFLPYFLLNHIVTSELRSSIDDSPAWLIYLVGTALVVSLLLLTLENLNKQWKLAQWAKTHPGLSYVLLYPTVFVSAFNFSVVYCIGFLIFSVWFVMWLLLQKKPIAERLLDWPPGVAYELVVAIVIFLVSLGLFGTTLYGHIQPQYGGGHPARVRVVLTNEKRKLLNLSGLPSQLDTMLADTQLIDSTDQAILILLKSSYEDKGILLELDRSIVDAILYLPFSR
jgi:hypothetical protein